MSTPDVFIVGAARTPIGKFLGGLSSLKASDLGAIAIREAMKRAGVAGNEVDEVLMGHVVQGGQGQAPARQAQIKAGIDPARRRGHHQQGVRLGSQGRDARRAGDQGRRRRLHRRGRAGEHEHRAALPVQRPHRPEARRHARSRTAWCCDGLWCSFNDCHMIELAQYTAEKAKLTRERAGRVLGREPRRRPPRRGPRAGSRRKSCRCSIPQRKGDPIVIAKDESIRPDTTLEGARASSRRGHARIAAA